MSLTKLKYVVFIFLLSLLACGLNTGEQIPAPRIEGFSVGCLNGIDNKVTLYLKGQLDERQITLVSNCLQTALQVFKNQVHGQKRGEFTPYELRKFIQDLFLQDNIIRDPLLNQLARLKHVIIGGGENTLTKKDIEKFIVFVEILKKSAVFFQPYLKALHVLNQKDSKKDLNLLKTIDQDLKKSISRVSIFFKSFANPYPLKDMEALFRELDFFPDHHYNISLLKEKTSLIGALKSFIFGRSEPHIAPEEWDGFFTTSAYLISAYVNWTILKKQSQWLSPKGTKALSRVINNGILFLSLALQNRPNRPLRTEDFLNLHQHLKKAEFMPNRVGDKGMKSFLTILFGKVFAPPSAATSGPVKTAHTQQVFAQGDEACAPTLGEPIGDSKMAQQGQPTASFTAKAQKAECDDGYDRQKNQYEDIGLTASHIREMQEKAQFWKETQSFIDYNYSSKAPSVPVRMLMPSFFSTPSFFQQADKIFKNILSLKPLYNGGKKIQLSTGMNDSNNIMNYKNIKLYSFYHFIANMIKKGYENHAVEGGESPGMTQEELTEFFTDLRPFAVDMGWLEKRSQKAVLKEGEAEFIAANVLTFSAEGFNRNWKETEYLTHKEIVEYLAYAFSFAFSLQELGLALFKLCADNADNADKTDKSRNWTNSQYDKDCVQGQLIPILQQNTQQNMSDFQKALKTMSAHQQQELAQALIHISYETDEQYQKSLYMTKSHLKNIIMALYFVETTITRYDKNQNLTLEADEIWEAFPVFQGYLSRVLIKLLCQESDDIVKDVYAYTIYKGALPASNTLTRWDKGVATIELHIHKMAQKWGLIYWDLFLDRTKLTQVFSALTKGLLHKKQETVGTECSLSTKQYIHLELDEFGFIPNSP